MLRRLFILILLLATAMPAQAQPVQRNILAMYNGGDERAIDDTRLHLLLETPLNHLGYMLDYRELSAGLPDLAELRNYAAVVSWIEADVAVDGRYFELASQAMDAGVKWIVFGDIGAASGGRNDPAYHGFMERLGLLDTGEYVTVTHDAALTMDDRDSFGFEAAFSDVLSPFPAYFVAGPEVDVLLSARSPQISSPAILAAISPRGGYVASGYGMDYIEVLERSVWYLNPFRFLTRVMDREPWPIPDTTTLSGRRIYFSHIDGDGWINASRVDDYVAQGLVSAEVIQREAIENYPDLPVSVGIVAGDIIYEGEFTSRAARSARDIFALPQVEVATHTMTHPFLWRRLVAYDRQAEVEDLLSREVPQPSAWQLLLAGLNIEQLQAFTPPPGDPWRFYAENPYSVDEEIADALEVSESLAPEGKAARLYLWSGDTSPGATEIAATRAAGVTNMNGGDTRFDGVFPSLTYVAPLSRTVGSERQIYAVNSNENTYTNLWRGPFYGQLLLEETWERTGSPRRLRPMNLYYHMYAGERLESLQALTHHLDIARSSPVIPIEASRYARIADGFFKTRITKQDDGAWLIEGADEMQTVRFDGVDARLRPDYDKSRGILGHRFADDALYISLDGQLASRLLTLTMASEPKSLGLAQSRWSVSDLQREACGLSARVEGYGRPEMEWWAPPGRYRITFERDGATMWQEEVQSSDDLLRFNPDFIGPGAMTLRLSCLEDGA